MLYKKRIILNSRVCRFWGSTHCTNAVLSPSKVHDCVYVMYCSTHTFACHGERWFKCTHRYTQKKLWASFNKKERQQRQPCIVRRDRTEAAAARNTTVFIWSAGKRGFVARDVGVATRNAKMCVRSAVWRYAGVKLRFSASKGSNSCRVNPVLCFSIVFRMYCQCSRVLCL